MIKSMTAFGRAIVDSSEGQWIFEILSVNRKGLDITFYMPKEWLRFDPDMRKWISGVLSRGQITVKIYPPTTTKSLFNLERLKELQRAWHEAALALGYQSQEVNLKFLVDQMKNPIFEESAISSDLLKLGIEAALKQLVTMREVEGQALSEDIVMRIQRLSELVDQIESLVPQSVLKTKQKLTERLKEFGSEIEGRILQEIIIFSEKVDVTEEIVRLRSHFAQMIASLNSSESVGRKWDFIAQEMLREVNTIGSKAADIEIIERVVEMKSLIEKIKEQVQNVE